MYTNYNTARMRKHNTIERTHISLTSWNNWKSTCHHNPKHIRKIWDLSTRVLEEANPNLLGIFLFGRYLERYFEKRGQKWTTQKYTQQTWILLAGNFSCVVSDLLYSSPLGLRTNWFFVCLLWGSTPAVGMVPFSSRRPGFGHQIIFFQFFFIHRLYS